VRPTVGPRALRLVPAEVAVVSIVVAFVGFVLFDTDASIWRYRLWLVKEVLPGAIVFSLAGAVLIGYRQARAVGAYCSPAVVSARCTC
jgi:hypothetical protein